MLWTLCSGAGFEVMADDIGRFSRWPGRKYYGGLRASTGCSNKVLTVNVGSRFAATRYMVSFNGCESDGLEYDQLPSKYALL